MRRAGLKVSRASQSLSTVFWKTERMNETSIVCVVATGFALFDRNKLPDGREGMLSHGVLHASTVRR
jgi:hypothetical protein